MAAVHRNHCCTSNTCPCCAHPPPQIRTPVCSSDPIRSSCFLNVLGSLILIASVCMVAGMFVQFHCVTFDAKHNMKELSRKLDSIMDEYDTVKRNYDNLESQIGDLRDDKLGGDKPIEKIEVAMVELYPKVKRDDYVSYFERGSKTQTPLDENSSSSQKSPNREKGLENSYGSNFAVFPNTEIYTQNSNKGTGETKPSRSDNIRNYPMDTLFSGKNFDRSLPYRQTVSPHRRGTDVSISPQGSLITFSENFGKSWPISQIKSDQRIDKILQVQTSTPQRKSTSIGTYDQGIDKILPQAQMSTPQSKSIGTYDQPQVQRSTPQRTSIGTYDQNIDKTLLQAQISIPQRTSIGTYDQNIDKTLLQAQISIPQRTSIGTYDQSIGITLPVAQMSTPQSTSIGTYDQPQVQRSTPQRTSIGTYDQNIDKTLLQAQISIPQRTSIGTYDQNIDKTLLQAQISIPQRTSIGTYDQSIDKTLPQAQMFTPQSTSIGTYDQSIDIKLPQGQMSTPQSKSIGTYDQSIDITLPQAQMSTPESKSIGTYDQSIDITLPQAQMSTPESKSIRTNDQNIDKTLPVAPMSTLYSIDTISSQASTPTTYSENRPRSYPNIYPSL